MSTNQQQSASGKKPIEKVVYTPYMNPGERTLERSNKLNSSNKIMTGTSPARKKATKRTTKSFSQSNLANDVNKL